MSKRHDYTSSLDNHENFKRSALIASWFVSDEDKPYVVLIGTKLARLASLLVLGKTPNNESIEDTFLDLVNYCALWMERRTTHVVSLNDNIPMERLIQQNPKQGILQGSSYYCICRPLHVDNNCPIHGVKLTP